MDRTDLELSRLRWRISILQALVVDAYVGLASSTSTGHPYSPGPETGQDTHATAGARLFLACERAHQQGTQEILESTGSQEERLLRAQECARVVHEMKAS